MRVIGIFAHCFAHQFESQRGLFGFGRRLSQFEQFVGLLSAQFSEFGPPLLGGFGIGQFRRRAHCVRQREHVDHRRIALRQPFARQLALAAIAHWNRTRLPIGPTDWRIQNRAAREPIAGRSLNLQPATDSRNRQQRRPTAKSYHAELTIYFQCNIKRNRSNRRIPHSCVARMLVVAAFAIAVATSGQR